jgi:hypothetical protein
LYTYKNGVNDFILLHPTFSPLLYSAKTVGKRIQHIVEDYLEAYYEFVIDYCNEYEDDIHIHII